MTKQLTEKAIDIKWKKYVLVSDRVLYFNETYPNGCIQTVREYDAANDREIIKAVVCPDCSKPERIFTWYSQAKRWDGFINKSAALEQAETSAIWRALWFMGIWVIDAIASLDEINKAENTAKSQKSEPKENPNWRFLKATKSVNFMKSCLDEDDFIKKIKEKYTVDEIQERQLREAYKNEMHIDEVVEDLPFWND